MQSSLHDVVLYGFLQPNAAGYMHVSVGFQSARSA
jgi:hypothetical protein